MTKQEFWHLIEQGRQSVPEVASLPDWLVERLSHFSIANIVDFDRHFDEAMDASYDERLQVACAVICGSCGDDGFDHFRGWLIAQGQQTFESACRDPDSLALVPSFKGRDDLPELEHMLYVARRAYQRHTGRDDLESHLPRRSPPTLKNRDLWDGRGHSLRLLVPQLVMRFPLPKDFPD